MIRISETTRNQRVYHAILSHLLTGEIPAGTQLDERTLADQHNVSRTPVREAIIRLVREGLIEYYPYRGHFVKTWTVKQVQDLFEVRKALEALAIRIAVRKISDEDIDEISAILNDVDQAIKDNDLKTYGEADKRFHQTIINKTDNQTLIDALNQLTAQIQLIRSIANRDPGLVERTLAERPRILQALRTRDADMSALMMVEHIQGVEDAVIAQMKALEQEN